LSGLGDAGPDARLRLFNMLGEEVLSTRVTGAEQTLDLSVLADGVYMLELITGAGRTAQRVVVQR